MHSLILILKKRQSNPNGGTFSKRISLHSPQTRSALQTVEGWDREKQTEQTRKHKERCTPARPGPAGNQGWSEERWGWAQD